MMDVPQQNLSKPLSANRAFTLIEVLIVIGIIAFLITMAVISYRVVGGMGKSRATTIGFETCKTLVNSYQNTTSLEGIFDQNTYDAIVAADRWEPPTSGVANSLKSCIALTPGLDDGGAVRAPAARAQYDRFLRDETARVLARLMSSPQNRKVIEALPPERVIKLRYALPTGGYAAASISNLNSIKPTGTPAEYTAAQPTQDGVNFLDGNGHPIYFIPGGGLKNVNLGYKGSGDKSDPASYDNPKNNGQTIHASDYQPFWASPGPDGDLTTGDDNAYSFEN